MKRGTVSRMDLTDRVVPVVVADDLTGATDTAVQFARTGWEIELLLSFRPDCWMIANNTLHKIYGEIADRVPPAPPMFHAIDLVRDHLVASGFGKVLLLGTRFTMEDSYYAGPLMAAGVC